MKVLPGLNSRDKRETVALMGPHMAGEQDTRMVELDSNNNRTRDNNISRLLESQPLRKLEEEDRVEIQARPWEFLVILQLRMGLITLSKYGEENKPNE
jgi:hypothetical protein